MKKPSQIKKRLITTQPPVLYHNGDFEEINERANDKIFTRNTSLDNSEKSIVQEEDCGMVHDYKTCQNYNDSIKNNSASDRIHITADEQSDITYFMMDNDSVNIGKNEIFFIYISYFYYMEISSLYSLYYIEGIYFYM